MTPRSAEEASVEIVLDVSRLLARILHATPTGVDRVEMAYARHLLALAPERLRFAAVHPSGFYGRVPTAQLRAFLDETEAAWNGRIAIPRRGPRRWLRIARILWQLRPRRVPPRAGPRIVLQSSPHHLHRETLVRSILRSEDARLACFLHDLIPITFPEYARPGGDELHRRRIDTVARHATLVIANSDATRRDFLDHVGVAQCPPVLVAHLGIDRAELDGESRFDDDRPYFVCIGTIEPRKNHLLLLNIWRAMAAECSLGDVPRLLIVGRRGWENEQVVDMLERCPALAGSVDEITGMPDGKLHRILSGAQALLFPSFAEGYGMPVVEALDAGVPVICSDLPALREAGGDVPDFLDPLDGPAWARAIRDYAAPASPGRAAQLARMTGWRAPEWRDHLAFVLDAATAIAR